VPVLARGDAEGLIYKVALLEGELVEAQRAQDVARERERERERVRCLSNSSAKGVRWLVASETVRREQFGEFLFCGLVALSCAFPSLAHHR
jgi:hypothetical protein